METKKCLYCGKDFVARVNAQSFCSVSCGSRYYGNISKKMRVCKRCNEEFWTPDSSKKRSRYCPTCTKLRMQEAEEKREQRKQKVYVKECAICGEIFETTIKRKLTCSDVCRKKYECIKSREISLKKNASKVCICKVCGKKFTPIYGSKNRTYCCEEHKEFAEKIEKCARRKKYTAHRKRQMKSAFVEPVYLKKLYDSAKGICGICGRHVEFDKSPTNEWGLTRDHIVPLSKGGKHCMDNCQIAHRLCNSYKLNHLDFHINWDEIMKYPREEWGKHIYASYARNLDQPHNYL